ncbi:hypothetical protein P43SY_010713 [Pythium insidiosum]|uniref:Reverse transcriptase Ty1/copia-type domain-containing protein n=1 Tax=Pythium insidiosum TaxID=114742 RepID=A0AAD5L5V2_PYTIN|nr:hypothetical protein P43SY_010713 [Pythium insidiosum]
MNAFAATQVLGPDDKPILASQLKLPRNNREARRSKFADLFRMAQLEELAALRGKGVLGEIPKCEMPEGAKAIRTMWVWACKTDMQGYVTRIKARLVALGNHQRAGIDYIDTYAPVARSSTFRLLVAIAALFGLTLFGGDINTAYLNAPLKIPQYITSIDGFPCKVDGHIYVVLKALYGLRQSGREWNTEFDRWLTERGFQRSATDPCLYFRNAGGSIMLVLIYVDDIVCATNDEAGKVKLLSDLDKSYGIKDQGELQSYLGMEITQTEDAIYIAQSKHARAILEKFGYSDAHKSGNPMETNVKYISATCDDAKDSTFDYRGAIGMLMYLATCTLAR